MGRIHDPFKACFEELFFYSQHFFSWNICFSLYFAQFDRIYTHICLTEYFFYRGNTAVAHHVFDENFHGLLSLSFTNSICVFPCGAGFPSLSRFTITILSTVIMVWWVILFLTSHFKVTEEEPK